MAEFTTVGLEEACLLAARPILCHKSNSCITHVAFVSLSVVSVLCSSLRIYVYIFFRMKINRKGANKMAEFTTVGLEEIEKAFLRMEEAAVTAVPKMLKICQYIRPAVLAALRSLKSLLCCSLSLLTLPYFHLCINYFFVCFRICYRHIRAGNLSIVFKKIIEQCRMKINRKGANKMSEFTTVGLEEPFLSFPCFALPCGYTSICFSLSPPCTFVGFIALIKPAVSSIFLSFLRKL